MRFIRQNATHKVVIGPFVDVGDGFTPETGVALSTADEAEAIRHDGTTVVSISAYTWAAITTMDGYYNLTLQSGITDTIGHLVIAVHDDSVCLPVRAEFTVVEEAVYDALFASSADIHTAAISDIESSLVIVKSDLVIITSDTTAIHSDTTVITSDVVILDNAISDIESSLVIIKSDLVVIDAAVSDVESSLVIVKSDLVIITSDTTQIASDVVVMDAAISDVESSLVIVKSDIVVVDAAISDVESSLVIVKSDLVVIESDTTAIEAAGGALTAAQDSKLTKVTSDVVIVGSDVVQIYSDTTIISSDTAAIEAGGGALTAAQDSKLTKVTSDVVIVGSDVIQIYSDTTVIASDVAETTVALIADGVWDEAIAAHLTAGSAGLAEALGSSAILDTTITGTPTSTTIQLTAGSSVEDFYNDQPVYILTGTGVGQVRVVLSYSQATKTITIDEAWGTTPASGDRICILVTHIHPITQIANQVTSDMDTNSTQLTTIASDLVIVQSDTTAIESELIVVHSETTALQAQATTIASDLVQVYSDTTVIASDVVVIDAAVSDVESSLVIVKSDLVVVTSATSNIESSLVIVKSDIVIITSDTTAIEVDTAAMQPKVDKIPLSDGTVTWNATALASINAEADTALTDYDGPTNTEMEARTPTAAQLAYIVANASLGVPVTFTTSGGSTTAAVLNQVDGSGASSTDDLYNGRLLVFTDGTLKDVVTDITDYVGSTLTATITAIPFAPTSSHNARLI